MDVVGDNVREIRLRRGLTQTDLKHISGVGQDTVSGIERGKYHPRPATLRKLANALGVSVDDFFTEEPADPKAATPPGSAPAVAGSRGEGRLARLEATTTSILSTIEELDPANNPLDRVAVDYIEAQILEITRVLAEKTGARDNPLPSRLRDILETEGEETEVLGIVETPVRPLMAWSKHQPTDQPRVSDRRQRP